MIILNRLITMIKINSKNLKIIYQFKYLSIQFFQLKIFNFKLKKEKSKFDKNE